MFSICTCIILTYVLLSISLQAQSYCQYQSYPKDYHNKIHFRLGVCLRLIGFIINIQSDTILLNLRKNTSTTKNESNSITNNVTTTKYKIPHGGLFQYISCANFFGEIIEWLGYAIASSSLAGWAFLVFVCANLIPRGMAHHQWYLDKFKDDYPKNRYAVIPFVC